MHQCFLLLDNKKCATFRQSPDCDGYIMTSTIRITPISKTNKIQQNQKFGLTNNDGEQTIVSGQQTYGWGFRLHYCPFCGQKL